ncbi:MAG: hypothetical protein KDK05_12015 [Candidatus Competibacteraceae bacterium]|nr:hypothetical protein [Candidatus Competibacteraceae bacterium]
MTTVIPKGGGNPSVTLLDAVEAVTTGDWYKLPSDSFSLDILITDTATVVMEGTNNPAAEATPSGVTAQTIQIDGNANTTASAFVGLSVPVAFIRARVSDYTAGSVSVFLAHSEQ